MSRLNKLIQDLCPNGVKFEPLAKLIQLNFGERITKLHNAGSLCPVYGGGGESFRTDEFNRQNEYVVSRFAMSRECVRKVKGKFWLLDSGFTFSPLNNSTSKAYIAYWLLNSQDRIFSCTRQGAQKISTQKHSWLFMFQYRLFIYKKRLYGYLTLSPHWKQNWHLDGNNTTTIVIAL